MSSILQPQVAEIVAQYGIIAEELACDPNFADTAVFNERYGFAPEQSANTILVASRKVEPTKYAVCVVLASSRLDVNKKVCALLGIKKASFADGETTKRVTGMEIGGVTAIGTTDLPIYVDATVMQQAQVVMGGGNRTSKLVLAPQELLKYPNVEVIDDLAKQIAIE